MQTKQKSHATHIWLHYLPCHQKFCFGLNRHCIFVRSLLYIFEFEYVWTCFFSMLHSFAISPSQCAPKGSAEQSTYIFSVAWLVHNLLIALPALPPTILFWFEQQIAFLPVHLFHIHFWVWICLNMFFLYVSSICLFSSQRLSRAIYQYIFSRQTGTQFPDCITCLVNTNFVLVFTDNCAFVNLLILYFRVWKCLNVLFLCFIHLQFSILVCSHRLSRATTDRHPEGLALLSRCAKSCHSFAHYPVQALPTSHLN